MPFQFDKASADAARTIGALSSIGFAFVLAIVLGFWFGRVLDRWFPSVAPLFSILFFFFGLAAGILNVYRTMKYVSRNTPER